MRIFVVRRGDTLYSIARMFGTTTQEISYVNQLSDPNRLSVGQALVIPGGSAPKLSIEVNAYAYPNIGNATLSEALPYLTFLSPFSWQLDPSGSLTPIADERMVTAAYDGGAAPLLTVTNIGASGGFSSETAHALFTDPAVQDAFFQNMFSVLRGRRYYGVNLNLEYVYPFDRESYNVFLQKISQELHAKGYYLISTVAPKTSDSQSGLLYEAHDYAAHGKYCDRVVIMTYEWGYTYSSPQAVSPVNRMRQVLSYAVTRIPSGKLLMGFSNYGYDWRLPHRQGQPASVISNVAAQNLAASKYAEIKFDTAAQAPYFNYTAPDGVRHEVWFEDARSVRARLRLVSEFDLAGISYWTVNFQNRAGFAVLGSEYSVEKIV